MLKKLLIILAILVGIVITVFNPLVAGVLAIPVWIYLVVMIRRQRTATLNGETKKEITGQQLKWLNILLILAVIFFLTSITGIFIHNFQHGTTGFGAELFFYFGIIALYLYIFSTAGSLYIYLRAQR